MDAAITQGRIPPHNLEAEQSVLGSMIRDNNVISDVLQIVEHDEHFYTDAHRKIFKAIKQLYERAQPIDLVTLGDQLHQNKHVEDIGGYGYLAQIFDATPAAANAVYYARIVRDKSILRSLIHAGTEILRDAQNPSGPAQQVMEDAERKIFHIAEMGIIGQYYTLEEALNDVYDRIDARHQRDPSAVSGLPTGYVDLDNITAGLQESEMIIVAARPSVGKCVTRDTEILLPDGSLATIGELHWRRRAKLLTVRTDWRLGWAAPADFIHDGSKPVYRVTTRLGRQVETTLCHPFLTLAGWKPLAELRPGVRIAVPRTLPVFGTETIRTCEVKLLAYLLGDGCLTDAVPEFTNSNPRLRDDFAAAVAEFGGLRTRLETSGGKRTPTLCVIADPAMRSRRRQEFSQRLRSALRQRAGTDRDVAMRMQVSPGALSMWAQGKCVPLRQKFDALCTVLEVEPEELAPHGHAHISKQQGNPLTHWLKGLGLHGKDSLTKFIPAPVFRLPKDQLALFLNRLFATDGWATVLAGGNPQLGYATVSERLARQLQHLLLRFGIIASVRQRQVRYKESRRVCWQLDITDQKAIRTFLDEIGIFGKEDATVRVAAAMVDRNHQTNQDLLPLEAWEMLAKAKGDLSWCGLARKAGLANHSNIHVGKRCLSRKRLKLFATALENAELLALAESDVYWDEIVSIEYQGEKQVYDLTIPETHNFIANDVCVHNTAVTLNLVRNMAVDEGLPIFYVSLEQSRVELAERLLSCQAMFDGQRLRRGHLSSDDMQRIINAGGILREAKIFIDDSPGQTMLRIMANARRLKHRHSIRAVFVDYLQLVEPDDRRESRQEQVAVISRRLKFMAKELKIPVVACAQLNRAVEHRAEGEPKLADLRESGSIEQDADTVMLLHRPKDKNTGQDIDGVLKIIIAKQRNGPTGSLLLTHMKHFMRFENYAGPPLE